LSRIVGFSPAGFSPDSPGFSRILPDSSGFFPNGVQCRVWKVQVTEYGSGLENRPICLGVKDHLPYEVTSDYDGSRTTFSDFNAAIEIPEMASIAASDEGSRASNP
jgi:hypothetical protein